MCNQSQESEGLLKESIYHVLHSGLARFVYSLIIKVRLQIFGKDTDKVAQTAFLISNISDSPLIPLFPDIHSTHFIRVSRVSFLVF